jgi:plasmid stabilization system protein ParE
MPHVTLRSRAEQGVARCGRYLAARNPLALKDAVETIKQRLRILETMPDIGTPSPTIPGVRELKIAFGDSGYVALYRHDPAADTVYVLDFRHQREGGY